MGHDLLAHALANPARLPFLALDEWNRLLRYARRSELLARVASQAFGHQAGGHLPHAAREPLEQAQQISGALREQRHTDLLALMQVVAPIGIELVALKGTAHWLCDITVTNDRQFAELDVWAGPQSGLQFEAALLGQGWLRAETQPGMRVGVERWLGPVDAAQRVPVLNVHADALSAAPFGRFGLGLQWAARLPVADAAGLHVPAPTDMVLCAVAQLFRGPVGNHGLRDLSDIDMLLRRFGSQPGFWTDLLERADLLCLSWSLRFALRQAQRLLGTPVPSAVHDAMRIGAPPRWLSGLMNRLWSRLLCTPRSQTDRVPARLSALLLSLHARWLGVAASVTRRL